MGKYTINNFKVGDEVYHLSNAKLVMVVFEIHKEMNEVSCRWIDNNGQLQNVEFMAEELGKLDDLRPKITWHAL